MIAAVHDRRTISLQPITKRKRRMIEVARQDLYVADIEGPLDKVMIANRSPELIRGNREISVLHLPGQRFAHGLVKAPWAVDVPFIAGRKKRREKRNALNVIPMRVADQDMTSQALGVPRDKILTKGMSSATAVENDKRSARRAHLNT